MLSLKFNVRFLEKKKKKSLGVLMTFMKSPSERFKTLIKIQREELNPDLTSVESPLNKVYSHRQSKNCQIIF